ncbi:DNA gyrase inhibitor YacG [Sphingomonas aliaeris]|uniref:DNA gyrase inhibitor YacG n=1 Tax=Sphingomonas aliaeris TaxID=2759526 RepID=A0A974S4S4_9SPHN|nr:DNA gyrase inhibitor YacG [Sphingomonas aliaeris]QQV77769.1 DNA gyrase inhibitor YacG [Sphingomonas aliaeris]
MAKTDACPICGKPASATHKPFCSQGCRDRDLLQWLGEGYRIPAGPTSADEADSLVDHDQDGLDSRKSAD